MSSETLSLEIVGNETKIIRISVKRLTEKVIIHSKKGMLGQRET